MFRTSIALGVVVLLLSGATAGPTRAQDSRIPSYYNQNRFSLTSPSALATPAGGYTNPAAYGTLWDLSAQFSWSNEEDRIDKAERWGAFLGFDRVGFGMIETPVTSADGRSGKVQDMRLALVDRYWDTSVALAYGWSGRDDELAGRSNILQVGLMHEVGRVLRFGAAGAFAVDGPDRVGYFDIAVRPVGKWFTVFADAELPRGTSTWDAPWSAGALLRAFRVLQVSGRYFSDETFMVSVGLNFYDLWLTGSPRYDNARDRTSTSYEMRIDGL